MPPTRTRSQAGGGISKKVHRKARPVQDPGDSWELLDRQGLDPNAQDRSDSMPELTQGKAAMEIHANVEKAVNPLRDVAEKVGRDVEEFAETVERFFDQLPNAPNRFDAAHDLILRFKDIANNTIQNLRGRHEREVREQLKREWSEKTRIPAASTGLLPFSSTGSTSMSDKKSEQIRQLRMWQQEADIWELLRIMLEQHPFEAEAEALHAERQAQLARLGPPNRYTSEGDLWVRFLLDNDVARERSLIKSWLEKTAEHQSSDLQGIVEELEVKAGRGKGLWSSGWLYTREKIKGEKRLRSWPNAVDPPLPQIRRSDNNELLATTLDPDAPSRQQRTLEKPDAYFERAVWVACWEMLRRGQSFEDICDWCEERKEGWRALCMAKGLEITDPSTSSAAWRRMCNLISQSGCSTDYEAAVFGLLGGNERAVSKVCRTLDDHLYAYYNASLLRQFDHYLISISSEKATPLAWHRNIAENTTSNPEQAQNAVRELLVRLKQDPSTNSEAAQPMKIIQSYILTDEVGSLIHTLGVAVAETNALHGNDPMYFREAGLEATGKVLEEMEVALEPQTLRIAAHMAIIHRVLSPEYLQGNERRVDENVLIAYIQALRAASRRSVIPTYAAQLSKERYTLVLGRVLQDVTNPAEQRTMIRVLEDTKLDVVPILEEHLTSAMKVFSHGELPERPLVILEPSANQELHPGKKIRHDYLTYEATTADEAIISSLNWFDLLRGGWSVTFRALTQAVKGCLVSGRFATARLIFSSFPFEEVSKKKAYDVLGSAVNVMDDNTFMPRSEKEAMLVELMRRQSKTYFELEQLIKAAESFAAWRTEEYKCEEDWQRPLGQRKQLADQAFDGVKEAVEPILRGILLNATDDKEAEQLDYIRTAYIPEIIMAYNGVLYASAGLLSRDGLIDSMDLSAIIANDKIDSNAEESNGLTECFMKAGRLRELVNGFAVTSKRMLVMGSAASWKPKKHQVGKDLGMWQIGVGAHDFE